jgi:hypothetical protein
MLQWYDKLQGFWFLSQFHVPAANLKYLRNVSIPQSKRGILTSNRVSLSDILQVPTLLEFLKSSLTARWKLINAKFIIERHSKINEYIQRIARCFHQQCGCILSIIEALWMKRLIESWDSGVQPPQGFRPLHHGYTLKSGCAIYVFDLSIEIDWI